ncbi:MAG: sulfotransferase [Nitrosospira sp.]|nr:sulfotransferase [Nitrosospira sp.]
MKAAACRGAEASRFASSTADPGNFPQCDNVANLPKATIPLVDPVTKLRTPNLFIIGAPKCGTTALSHYLAGHPDVYMSEQSGNKEPGYYSPDNPTWTQVESSYEYYSLFDDAPQDVPYIGEASPSYLNSHVAAKRILTESTNAKLIVMVRNPIDMTRACHNQLVRAGCEPQVDFERAWRLQGERLKGRSLPKLPNPLALQYGVVSKLGVQLDRLLQVVPKERVHIVVYDDFAAAPLATYAALLRFLNVEDDKRVLFPRVNPSVRYRIPVVQKGMIYAGVLRERMMIPRGLGIQKVIDRFNVRSGRISIRAEFRRELQDYFLDDVALLSSLLNRDLLYWLE